MSCDLPDGEAHDDHLLLGVVLAVMVTPFRCPEAINADGDESVDRRQRRPVVDDTPDAAHNAPERPVPDQNSDG